MWVQKLEVVHRTSFFSSMVHISEIQHGLNYLSQHKFKCIQIVSVLALCDICHRTVGCGIFNLRRRFDIKLFGIWSLVLDWPIFVFITTGSCDKEALGCMACIPFSQIIGGLCRICGWDDLCCPPGPTCDSIKRVNGIAGGDSRNGCPSQVMQIDNTHNDPGVPT